MSGHVPAPLPEGNSEASKLLVTVVLLAAVVSAAGLISLAVILVGALFGAEMWPGFVGIAWVGFPIAFLLMGAMIVRNIRRRRRL
ncbi:hypothetical protein D477_007524 [Arthrobacter crystallopoietes BAB-32]|uniref:Uncharacterized protein n=1 Tax=Arthrobacter crystallopoietes BAB-32 TaxID=1246476 RepID=N1V440_9MICC|nr:hypothetical protein [Arthrobacter crystallopoietes]EMY34817.1 hypothetical protein D477_007524 [Arthrobacter crystallopoietes BAB-32]